MNSSLILINPWIYDFAAFDLWSKPLGLLTLAGSLRNLGFRIHLVDCLDVHHPGMQEGSRMKRPVRRAYGTGKYWRQKISPPEPLRGIERPYSRYGILPGVLEKELAQVQQPAAILITSHMTYWYPGVREVIALVRRIHPGVPVILGGIYAALCRDHATRVSGADRVVGGAPVEALLSLLKEYGITAPRPEAASTRQRYPAFDLLGGIDYICILTSTGCPFRCRYCASHFLAPEFIRRAPGEILDEILYWHREFAIRDFAFYDDALLVEFDTHLSPLLEGLARRGLTLRFHTPNAVHASEITSEIAGLMHRTGFRTLRLGLETSDFSFRRDLDDKISRGDFERAVRCLLQAGFPSHRIGAYILTGLPGQTVSSVKKTIQLVAKAGAIPFLAEYSPIPHTPLWEKAKASSEYDLSEPLFHNNSLLPCWDEGERKQFSRLKALVREVRNRYRHAS